MKKKELTLTEYKAWCAGIWTGSKRRLSLHDDFVMCTGLPGEVGEVLELLKKAQRDKKSVLLVNRKKLVKEIGDVLYYMMMICRRQGIDPQDVIDTNVKKLEARFKRRRR